MNARENVEKFCGVYLRTMDPDRAAEASGVRDGYDFLRRQTVGGRLEKMRRGTSDQLRREDVLRRLAQLAFGRANDAVALALRPGELNPETLDLSAVSEFKVTDKGGVEVKLADRVRAMETLCTLMEQQGNGELEALFQALEGAGKRLEGADDDGDA